jgi:hypothetical protein
MIVKAVLYILFDSWPKIYGSCQAKYPAGYPVSGFRISRISGRPDIRQKQYRYPVYP